MCGMDLGGLGFLSYVAWLDTETRKFALDHYIPRFSSSPTLLPVSPDFMPAGAKAYGFDGPQGLPQLHSGRTRRLCDEKADTPTRTMPLTLSPMYKGPYASLIKVSIRLFSEAVSTGQARLHGYPPSSNAAGPTIFETYPRKILKDHFGLSSIPSKRKEPHKYVEEVWNALKERDYRCSGVIRPTVDQLDAMLCAVAAEHLLKGQFKDLGAAPIWDPVQKIFREGYIVVPA
nr:DUF429 domain-containing protein [Alicyclobacillus acidocaldarius]